MLVRGAAFETTIETTPQRPGVGSRGGGDDGSHDLDTRQATGSVPCVNEITATLRWTDRGGRQQAVQMVERRPAFVVGNEGDVMLDDPLVSPRHARFERTEQTWRAIDCESTGLWLRRA